MCRKWQIECNWIIIRENLFWIFGLLPKCSSHCVPRWKDGEHFSNICTTTQLIVVPFWGQGQGFCWPMVYRPFGRSGHVVKKSHLLGRKLHDGTSKTKQLVPVHLDLPLFWKPHCGVPACHSRPQRSRSFWSASRIATSRFLVLTKGSAASGDENVLYHVNCLWNSAHKRVYRILLTRTKLQLREQCWRSHAGAICG